MQNWDSPIAKKGKIKMEYGIAHAPDWEQLMKIVNEAIEKGWEPQGGIATESGWFIQAMIRREDNS
jgi:hypothetical protein